MTFNEARQYRKETVTTINANIIDVNGNPMEMIIVPKNNDDRDKYFNYCRGSFSDELVVNYSSDDQYGVMAISYINEGDVANLFSKFLVL